MNKLDDVVSPLTVLLMFGLYIASFGVRRLVEAVFPQLSAKTQVTVAERVWEEWALPMLPSLLGLVFCLLCPPTAFAYPAVVAASLPSRALYGLGCGWVNAGAYRLIKAVIQKKWNVPFPDDSTKPPAPPDAVLAPVVIPPNPPPKDLIDVKP